MRKTKSILKLTLVSITLLCLGQEVATSKSEVGDLLEIQVYADRAIVKKGEIINIRALVASDLVDSVTFTPTAAENCLELQGKASETVSVPMKEPVKFVVLAKQPGKCNVLLSAEGLSKETQKPILAFSQLEGLEVQASKRPWTTWASHSLTGVFLGSLLTFCVTWINEFRQNKLKESQRRKWLIQTLPILLTENLVAIEQEKSLQIKPWENKLLVEGYYADLQDLITKKEASEDLPSELMRIGFLLRDYEKDRQTNRLTSQNTKEICLRLDRAINSIKKLGNTRVS